jgi:threonine dehydrogenase-like Zn-dependent dehydrogenase
VKEDRREGARVPAQSRPRGGHHHKRARRPACLRLALRAGPYRGRRRVAARDPPRRSRRVVSSPDELVAQVALRVGTTPLQPWSKHDWLQDGPAIVYDTIGSTETVETSLRLLTTGGTLIVSGVEPPKRFEWTPLYFKELRVIGSNGFGIEEVRGVAKHAMEHYFDFVSNGLDLTPVITHRFPLERWS